MIRLFSPRGRKFYKASKLENTWFAGVVSIRTNFLANNFLRAYVT